MSGLARTEGIPRLGVQVAWGAQEESPEGLYTCGIYECIGVALYDRNLAYGYMAHILASEESQNTLIPALIRSVLANSAAGTNLNAWITGGDADSDSASIFIPAMARRQRVIELLSPLNISAGRMHIDWNENEGSGLDLQLDCQSGNCTVANYYPGSTAHSGYRNG